MPLPKPLLTGTLHDYGIGHLVDMPAPELAEPTDRRLMNLTLPPWQRGEEWSEEQKRRFIEGIFLGLGTGYYVVHSSDWDGAGKPKTMSGWLLDGQQRISALRDFLAGKLVVFGDVRFTEMAAPDQLRFKRRPFPCHELEYTDNEDTLKELYDRLNFGGTPHSAEQRVLPTNPIHKEMSA
ncbi:MAG: hypothetical protein FD131_4624 [Rhodocyclaceae bacterium]|nr:MAG: hypothetical protein FD131_4624 [Rhodocyclaceae bacterium]